MVVPLSSLAPGQTGRVVWIAAEPEKEHHLSKLGFTPGQTVTCLLKGRPGCMSAYLADRTVFGLRERDAQVILVRI